MVPHQPDSEDDDEDDRDGRNPRGVLTEPLGCKHQTLRFSKPGRCRPRPGRAPALVTRPASLATERFAIRSAGFAPQVVREFPPGERKAFTCYQQPNDCKWRVVSNLPLPYMSRAGRAVSSVRRAGRGEGCRAQRLAAAPATCAPTASTMCRAEMPNRSSSSSGLPLRGISRTASRCTWKPASATASATASPIPPAA